MAARLNQSRLGRAGPNAARAMPMLCRMMPSRARASLRPPLSFGLRSMARTTRAKKTSERMAKSHHWGTAMGTANGIAAAAYARCLIPSTQLLEPAHGGHELRAEALHQMRVAAVMVLE